jgi:uncharacterized membrane protein YdjX (TVP38/TMEM64 family)
MTIILVLVVGCLAAAAIGFVVSRKFRKQVNQTARQVDQTVNQIKAKPQGGDAVKPAAADAATTQAAAQKV